MFIVGHSCPVCTTNYTSFGACLAKPGAALPHPHICAGVWPFATKSHWNSRMRRFVPPRSHCSAHTARGVGAGRSSTLPPDDRLNIGQQLPTGAHRTGIVVQWKRALMQLEQGDVGQSTFA